MRRSGCQALRQPSTDTFSFHAHCSCVILGWVFGKRLGSRRARKTRGLPLDKSNIYTGFETGMLCTSPSWLGVSLQDQLLAAESSACKVQPETRAPKKACEQPRGSTEAPATAGVTQQEGVGCWQLQETSVAAVGPGPKPAVTPSARRTPSGLQWWVACPGPNAYTTAWETFQGSWGERGPGL